MVTASVEALRDTSHRHSSSAIPMTPPLSEGAISIGPLTVEVEIEVLVQSPICPCTVPLLVEGLSMRMADRFLILVAAEVAFVY